MPDPAHKLIEFPQLKTSKPSQLKPDHNLPSQLTSFVGRDKEIAEVVRLLGTTRLLTLAGVGGVGKTRLGLEVASAMLDNFEDGVWLVELAPLSDPQLLPQEVILTLGLQEDPTRSQLATLREFLQRKQLLLVLDNCEHLITACAELAGYLLRVCPQLRILATSREALGIGGETVWQVSSLSLPDLNQSLRLENLAQFEATQLFIERARAVQPSFQVTGMNILAIAQICGRLDGMPLAIELAAARVKVLTPPQIATRLDDRFGLLVSGSRIAVPRQQTLRAAIDWSYDLLIEAEQTLLQRLSIFAGRFTLEAAEAICSDKDEGGRQKDEEDALGKFHPRPSDQHSFIPHPSSLILHPFEVLDLLAHLADKSLIIVAHDEAGSYRMLETIRQYAWEKLAASGELNSMRQRHLAFYLALAEMTEPKLISAEQVVWLERLEVEHDNLRLALTWSLESGLAELGLRLAAALGEFWSRRGYLSEGSDWLGRTLADKSISGCIRAKALFQAGRLAWKQGNYEQTILLSEQSMSLWRELGHKPGVAASLRLLGLVAHSQGERGQAAGLLEESLALLRETEDRWNMAMTLVWLGDVRLRQGDYQPAIAVSQESLALFRQLGDKSGIGFALGNLGEIARRQGNFEQAGTLFRESLSFYYKAEEKVDLYYLIEALAIVAAEQRCFERAACLWGAAGALREASNAPLLPAYRTDYAPYVGAARAALGASSFAAAWAQGQTLTLEQAAALAAAPLPQPSAPVATISAPTPSVHPDLGLTPREVEVLRLVAQGLTDAQVAAKLFLSRRTVSKHLELIYSKLDVTSRSAATRFALEHKLV
ncbi:MAG: tetratricopeptide repeat protein [Anaerolineae bacterium]